MRTIMTLSLLAALLLAPASALAMRAVEDGAPTESTTSSSATKQKTRKAPQPARSKGTLTIRTAPDGQTTGTPKPPAPKE
ncbi:hypothetical protein [Desulfocurvus sp. DL9XJH121]